MKKLLFLVGAIGLILVVVLMRPKKDDKAFLLNLPSQIAQLAEQRQAAEIKKYISKEYSDKEGRTYNDLNGIVTGHTIRQGEISIYVVSPYVDLDMTQDPPKATLAFKAAMTRGPKVAGALDVIPESATAYEFYLDLEKNEDGWQVKSGQWQPALK